MTPRRFLRGDDGIIGRFVGFVELDQTGHMLQKLGWQFIPSKNPELPAAQKMCR